METKEAMAQHLALKYFLAHGDALLSEDFDIERLMEVNLSLWEDIDRICGVYGFNRSNFRAAVMAQYQEKVSS